MCLGQFSRHIHSHQRLPNCSAYRGLQLSTDCHTHGTSQNGGDNQQLQTTNAQSCHSQDLANSIWKRLWKHGARQPEDRAKRNEFNLCDDARRNQKHPKESNGDLRTCSGQFLPSKGRSVAANIESW